MSNVSRGPGRPHGVPDAPGAGAPKSEPRVKGSVRAARERLREVQQAQENGSSELRQQAQRDNPLASQFASLKSPPRTQPQGHQPLDTSPVEAAPRQPSPLQWPLKNDSTPSPPMTSAATKNANKPLRPSRPSNATITSPIYSDPQPSQYPPNESDNWQNEDYASLAYTSPNPNRPLTTSSMSTNSSLGEIPDFPVPTGGLAPPRRIPYLGPPPSARRGPSSYYSQASYVSPIAEESEARDSTGSFASSNVIPSMVPEFYLEEGEGETPSDEENPTKPMSLGVPEEGGIVRQVSVGKKTKPTLTTIKGSDVPRFDSPKGKLPGSAGDSLSARQVPLSPHPSSLGGATILPDSITSPSSSEESLSKPGVKGGRRDMKSPNPWDNVPGIPSRNVAGSPPIDPRIDQILGGLEKGGALNATAPKTTFGELAGQRRPARLNVDAVREAEARGSLTSLPDLIRRATRLAANLDRGKTASRLGRDWMFADASKEKLSRDAIDEKFGGGMTRGSEASLSGILASFPNPGQATPSSANDRDQWPSLPSSRRQINSRREDDARKERRPGRRCCGMPLWGFVTLMLVLILLIAAAVIVPIGLIVLPRLHHSSNTESPLEVCMTTSPCENGGTATVQANNTCGCICANGFTGPSCLNPADAGCTSTSVPGQKNATIGSSIPSLLNQAFSLSIPLNASTILSIFASSNTSCAAENALVTFAGFSNQRRSLDLDLDFDLDFDTSNYYLPNLQHRNADNPSATTNGLLLDGSATATAVSATATSTLQTSPGSSPTSTADASGTDTSAPGTNSSALSFAKVGILFILQESGSVAAAGEAQSMIENFLTSAVKGDADIMAAQNVSLGDGLSKIDLWDFVVTLANGTEFGIGVGYNGTVTSVSPTVSTAGSATAW